MTTTYPPRPHMWHIIGYVVTFANDGYSFSYIEVDTKGGDLSFKWKACILDFQGKSHLFWNSMLKENCFTNCLFNHTCLFFQAKHLQKIPTSSSNLLPFELAVGCKAGVASNSQCIQSLTRR